MRNHWVLLFVGTCLWAGVCVVAQGQRGATSFPPDTVGKCTGVWSAYNPAQPATAPKEQCAKLEATVVKKGDVFEATFEGDCGRPYKYTITMEGRPSGTVVLFRGSADLGPKDGGVYDWIGRATDKEFVGFYTNAYNTGVFALSRQPQ
jgi:hypothetical protein